MRSHKAERRHRAREHAVGSWERVVKLTTDPVPVMAWWRDRPKPTPEEFSRVEDARRAFRAAYQRYQRVQGGRR